MTGASYGRKTKNTASSRRRLMVTVILGAFMAILVLFLIGVAWAANNKRKGAQGGLASEETPNGQTVDRGPGAHKV
jgi:Na+/proline symporter